MGEAVAYRWMPLREVLAQANTRDLIVAYYEELWPTKEIPIDPDWGLMQRREEDGIFKLWATVVGKTLAGFISFQIFPHMMSKSCLCAFDCGHYLAPAFRDTGRIGFKMWASVERPMQDMGVKAIVAHDNSKRSLMPFFLALRYEPRGTLFYKAL